MAEYAEYNVPKEFVEKLLPHLSDNPEEAKTAKTLHGEMTDANETSISFKAFQTYMSVLAGQLLVGKPAGKIGYCKIQSEDAMSDVPIPADRITDKQKSSSLPVVQEKDSILSSGTSTTIPSEAEQAEVIEELEEGDGRGGQREEKFRAIFMKYHEIQGRYPFKIKHEQHQHKKGEAGLHKWKFADVILVDWQDTIVNKNGTLSIEKDLLKIKTDIGDSPFQLMSVELKVSIETASLRKYFFQCLSNSKWAHQAILAVAYPIAREETKNELIRLGRAFGVAIKSYNLSEAILDEAPAAEEILALDDDSFKTSFPIKEDIVTSGEERDYIDWEFIRNLRSINATSYFELFSWIAYCLEERQPMSLQDWNDVKEAMKAKAEAEAKISKVLRS